MSWIDERIAERKALNARRKAIKEGAPAIYQALWDYIVDLLKEEAAASLGASSNGSPEDRVVSIPMTNPKGGDRPELHIRLSRREPQITVSGPGINLTFKFERFEDDLVSLEIGDSKISIEDAARKILDPFLFPDLPRKFRDYLLDNSRDLGHTRSGGDLNESYRRYQKVRNP
jgi:hypothetical protein